jgi:hypothetical protein
MVSSNIASMLPPPDRRFGAAVELPGVRIPATGNERAYALPVESPPVAGPRTYTPVTGDRLQLGSRVQAGGGTLAPVPEPAPAPAVSTPPPSARNLGESGWQDLIRFGNRIFAAGGHIEAAQQAIGAIPGAIMQPRQFAGAVGNAGKTLGRAGILSALIVGGMSLVTHGLRVMSGRESFGQAARTVSVDVAGAAGGGFMAAASAGAVAALFGAMGVGGVALGVLGAITGWLGYGWGEQQGRAIAGRLLR